MAWMKGFLRCLALGAALGLGGSQLKADTAEATITQPSGALTVWAGQAVAFAGTTSTDGSTFGWAFGDGGTGAGASTSHAYASPGTYTAVLTVSWPHEVCAVRQPDGTCSRTKIITTAYTASRTITVLAPPVISAFSASAGSVETGAAVTLSWTTANATGLSLSGVGTVTGTTSAVVYPSGTTTYTLTASNAGGSVSGSVTVATYTVSVGISPASASLKLGESEAFTGTIMPAGHGLSWSASGGSLSGSTFTGTTAGTFTVTVASTEDPAKKATATVTVSPAVVATPVSDAPGGKTFVGGVVHFTATVSGAVNTGVAWSVNGGGAITAAGVFTASTLGTWTVTATSTADPTKQATATIQVVPVAVAVTPGSATVLTGQNGTFSAAVTGPGSPSQGVSWSVVEAGGGTITSAGVYTAPATPGDYTVKATSAQDPSCSGTATVHVPGWVLKLKKDIVYVGAKEVAEIDATGKTWVTFDDHLGSPRFQWDGTANPTDGVNLIKQKYAPFGESLVDPTTQAKFSKGFTGHEQTDPSGLIYMQARFYAPMYGRFLSPDPALDQHFEDTQSWNIYSYVRNSPTMQVDPTGMMVTVDSAITHHNDIAAPPNEPTNQDASFEPAWIRAKRNLPFGWIGAQTKQDANAQTKQDANAQTGDTTGKSTTMLFTPSNGSPAFDIPATTKVGAIFTNPEDPKNGTLYQLDKVDGSSPGAAGVQASAANAKPDSPGRWSAGTFTFGGLEGDGALAGGFGGVIHEHDSKRGGSTGALTEGWIGGEGGVVGLGKITTTHDSSPLSGGFIFGGGSLSGGPFAGAQVGVAVGWGWIGVYYDGHAGPAAGGQGAYISW